MTGPQAYQPFMSPYQTQVIDATLDEFDRQRLGGQQQIRDAAVSSGNFGGGRAVSYTHLTLPTTPYV